MKKQTKYRKRVLTEEIYAELLRSVRVLDIDHAMIIAGNAWQYGGDRFAENSAMLAMLIAERSGGNVRSAAQVAWDTAESIEESRS